MLLNFLKKSSLSSILIFIRYTLSLKCTDTVGFSGFICVKLSFQSGYFPLQNRQLRSSCPPAFCNCQRARHFLWTKRSRHLHAFTNSPFSFKHIQQHSFSSSLMLIFFHVYFKIIFLYFIPTAIAYHFTVSFALTDTPACT